MEEKVILPKPPKALRQQKNVPQTQTQEGMQGHEEQSQEPIQGQTPEQLTQDEISKQKQSQKEQKAQKRKIDVVPIINWTGLAVSLVLFAVFVFLLCR